MLNRSIQVWATVLPQLTPFKCPPSHNFPLPSVIILTTYFPRQYMKRNPGANAIFSVGLLHPPSNDNQACSSKSDYPKKATEENPKQPASWNNIRVRCIYIKTHPRETTQARTPIEWCVLQNVGLKDGGIRRQRKLALRISKVGTVRRQIIAFYILGRSTTTVFLSLIAACLYFSLSFFFCLPPHEKGIDYSTYINIYIYGKLGQLFKYFLMQIM